MKKKSSKIKRVKSQQTFDQPKSNITFTSLAYQGKEKDHDLVGFVPLAKIKYGG